MTNFVKPTIEEIFEEFEKGTAWGIRLEIEGTWWWCSVEYFEENIGKE